MKLLAHIAAAWLGVNLGILAAAVTAAYREHEPEEVGTGAGEGAPRQDTGSAWVTRSTDCPEAPAQAHLLACTCDDWTAEELLTLAPDLVELDGMETFADFLYVIGDQ